MAKGRCPPPFILTALLFVPALPKGSDFLTPDQSAFNERFEGVLGATHRPVFDPADWDRGRATSRSGQMGQPGSPYYDNLIAPWEKGEYCFLVFSRKNVEEVAAHRLLLTPDKQVIGNCCLR
jgi:acyl-homoserine lactone acylase PvdQ